MSAEEIRKIGRDLAMSCLPFGHVQSLKDSIARAMALDIKMRREDMPKIVVARAIAWLQLDEVRS